MVFRFADCCVVPLLIPVVEALSFIAIVGLTQFFFIYVFGMNPTCLPLAPLTLCHSCVLVAPKFTPLLVHNPSKLLRDFW